jgi:hypothetical protein
VETAQALCEPLGSTRMVLEVRWGPMGCEGGVPGGVSHGAEHEDVERGHEHWAGGHAPYDERGELVQSDDACHMQPSTQRTVGRSGHCMAWKGGHCVSGGMMPSPSTSVC